MKTRKIEKDFLITDSTVNCYGFRLLTSGYLIDEFAKNPIGYHMHERNKGVIVRFEDLRIDGDNVYGKPVINMSHERGQQTVDEIENGFLNGASVGHIIALEWSEDPTMMLPGQTGPTVTKWYNRECSLVDVPGNFNALALYDINGTEINLAAFSNNQTNNMKQIFLTAVQLTALFPTLKAEATSEDVVKQIEDLKAEVGKVTQLQADLSAAIDGKTTAEAALAKLKGETVDQLVDDAVTATKCTKESGEQLKKLFAGKPEEAKEYIKTLQPYKPVSERLTDDTAGNASEVTKLMSQSGNDLFNNGGLDRLKELVGDKDRRFLDKYKEAIGSDYKEPA